MGTITLSRAFHARRPEVFNAWLDVERIARWLRPLPDVEVAPLSAEPRAGGGFELALSGADGRQGRLRGRYRELEAPERLVLALQVVWGDTPVLGIDELRVRFEERGATTWMELEQPLADEAQRATFESAWGQCLDRLPAVFDEALDAFYGRLQEYPRFCSRFGGLWPDLSDARSRLAGKVELGRLSTEEADHFAHWIEKGYVRLSGAVPAAAVDKLVRDIDAMWKHGHPEVRAEVFGDGQPRTFEPLGPAVRERRHKVLDLHGYLESARAVVFAPQVLRFATELFERPPLAFQSLYFTYGTEQEMHQDTAYVILRSPLEFCGCWIALEDVRAGSGELMYYAGSHRLPEYLWFGRGRGKPYDYADDADFLRWLREESERRGLPRERLLARKGDVLFWHADLVHGGSKVTRPGITRRSLVVHWCPKDVDPEFFGTSAHSPKLAHDKGGYYCFARRE